MNLLHISNSSKVHSRVEKIPKYRLYRILILILFKNFVNTKIKNFSDFFSSLFFSRQNGILHASIKRIFTNKQAFMLSIV